ncbi:preprotein translocase subunit YajC [Acetobacter sp. AN02]|uniref:preprotein translocase subunit YajC n=1 Tax=Acetobacter sp. AN02 TaxID=2894186 RepID=UPI0024344A27|nr:preprotein translocase subunit YajC [Acetobacter sp. AN02]MDG6095368.1 preprotein translocase subunit YajC [Acetobacter sp. AN02]
MPDFLISQAHAQSASGAGGMGSGLLAFLPYLAIFAVFYFLLILPQQRKQKQLKDNLGKLRRGDKVLTAGGIVGLVVRAQDGAEEVEIEIAPNVRVKTIRSTISAVLSPSAEPANDSK